MNIRCLASLLVLAAMPGYLSAQAPPPAQAPTPAAVAAPAAAKPAVAAPPASAVDAETLATRKKATGLGLKPRMKDGTEVYCKSSPEIGTRLPTLRCFTKQQVAELKMRTQSNQDDISALQRTSLTEPPAIEPTSGR